MYIRFVIGGDGDDHRSLTGLVTEARLLLDADQLAPHEVDELQATYNWLNSNLPCPPFSTSAWPRDAVSWFKDTATESIRQMRGLSALLEAHGLVVRMLRSSNPGKVLYEDPFQVVVAEWKRL